MNWDQRIRDELAAWSFNMQRYTTHTVLYRRTGGLTFNLPRNATDDGRGRANTEADWERLKRRMLAQGLAPTMQARTSTGMKPSEVDGMRPLGPAPWELRLEGVTITPEPQSHIL